MNQSFWQTKNKRKQFDPLKENIDTEVTIVGGGLTGIMSAYLLSEKGVRVVLLERDRLGNGTTGHTTAKITTQHGLIYHELLEHFGLENTKKYYQSQHEAMQLIQQLIEEYKIDCNFEKQQAILYTDKDQNQQKLVQEAEAYQKLAITGSLQEQIPFSIPIKQALAMDNQAQFHPLHFLQVIIDKIIENEVQIFEKTTAVDIDHSPQTLVKTDTGAHIKSDHVIVASQFPFYEGQSFYSVRMKPSRSYVVGFTAAGDYPGGMYLDIDDSKHSLRSVKDNEQTICLLGGESHKTGQLGKEKVNPYDVLKEYGNKYFNVKEWRYHWSAQDYITLDKLPYIGVLNEKHPNVYVATGYRKWGMTNGVVAAKLLTDLITNKDNPYEEIYTPKRFHADPDIKSFGQYNANVAKEFVKGKLQKLEETIDLKSESAIKVNKKGQTIGIYKDKNNQVYSVDTTCTHLGCECNWNDAEKTWDCPCHGSRFSYDGTVIEGPAIEKLNSVQMDK